MAVVKDNGWRAVRRDDLNRRAEAGRGVGNRLVPDLERAETEVLSILPGHRSDPDEEHLAGGSRDGLLVVGTCSTGDYLGSRPVESVGIATGSGPRVDREVGVDR